VSPQAPAVDPAKFAQWCKRQLGSQPAAELFRSGHLSAVIGVRLTDDRTIVVKVRPGSPRLAACLEVQRRLFESGYPCPEPLTDAVPLGDAVANAETYIPGGALLPGSGHSAQAFAEAFARLVMLAPQPAEVPALDPPPPWAAWHQTGPGLWPQPEDLDLDLNQVAGPAWLDEAGRLARDRLRACQGGTIIGHCDWLAGNLRWTGDELLVVHDWDSVAADSEAVLVGFAAALYSAASADSLATVADTELFLDAYDRARGRDLSPDERQRSWAAGVWTRAYDAKCQHAVGAPISLLTESDARERLRRAGIC
jgi:hypothetical protein